jgi:hypothetical protein
MRNETGLRTNVSRPVRQFLTAKRKKALPQTLRRPGSPHSKKHIPLPSNRQRNWIAPSAKRNPLRHRDAISGKTHARVPSPRSCYRHAFRRSTFQSPFEARGKARTNCRSPVQNSRSHADGDWISQSKIARSSSTPARSRLVFQLSATALCETISNDNSVSAPRVLPTAVRRMLAMSCAQGQRLSTQFLQAALSARDLESSEVPGSSREKRARVDEIEQGRGLKQRCQLEVAAHANSCPTCGPGQK